MKWQDLNWMGPSTDPPDGRPRRHVVWHCDQHDVRVHILDHGMDFAGGLWRFEIHTGVYSSISTSHEGRIVAHWIPRIRISDPVDLRCWLIEHAYLEE